TGAPPFWRRVEAEAATSCLPFWVGPSAGQRALVALRGVPVVAASEASPQWQPPAFPTGRRPASAAATRVRIDPAACPVPERDARPRPASGPATVGRGWWPGGRGRVPGTTAAPRRDSVHNAAPGRETDPARKPIRRCARAGARETAAGSVPTRTAGPTTAR